MSTARERATERSIEIATRKAQETIKKALLDLESYTLKRVDYVNVDTRNFANCGTEIFLK